MQGVEKTDRAQFIAGPWPAGLAWLAFGFVALGTARNAYRHLLCYSRPDLQQHVLRIILVGPIYAFCAALCLCMTESGCFFVRSVRDIWEAVVIYSFLTLIIEYMGGEHLCLHSLSEREEAVPHLFPLNLCLPPIPTGSMIRVPKIGALQFVVLKPVVAAISIVVYACGQFEDWYYQWTLLVVYNISYSVALYALYLIYWASHDHHSLQAKRPLLKFLSVKMIIFLTFWQALLLPHATLQGSPGRWEDLILAVEMTIFAPLMNAAFSWQEFHSGLRGSRSHVGGAKALKLDVGDLIDFDSAPVDQPGATGQPVSNAIGRGQVVVQNAKAAFCPRDIIIDASANFSRRYQQHVLIESAQEYELRASEARSEAETASGPAPTAEEAQQPAGATSRAHGGLRTFRARTYLLGRSLGLGKEAPPPPTGPAAACTGSDASCAAEPGGFGLPHGAFGADPGIASAPAQPHSAASAGGAAGGACALASTPPSTAATPPSQTRHCQQTVDIGEPAAFGNPFA